MAHDRDFIPDWEPSDPCKSCGSKNTGFNAEDGGFCMDCGASDSDDPLA
jgi:hypothetical protein